uniref:Uncharacterized protein n=1 Tax=Aegilops tauschii subsp. strangulata TaxID=200361 RepID=A0A453T2E7_AEGTS
VASYKRKCWEDVFSRPMTSYVWFRWRKTWLTIYPQTSGFLLILSKVSESQSKERWRWLRQGELNAIAWGRTAARCSSTSHGVPHIQEPWRRGGGGAVNSLPSPGERTAARCS